MDPGSSRMGRRLCLPTQSSAHLRSKGTGVHGSTSVSVKVPSAANPPAPLGTQDRTLCCLQTQHGQSDTDPS